jgi:predicted peptidase
MTKLKYSFIFVFVFVFVFLFSFALLGQKTTKAYRIDTVLNVYVAGENRLPYAVLRVQCDGVKTAERLPLILFFHGAGERGVDNKVQLSVGLPTLLATLSNIADGDFYVLAPQCPENHRWVDTDWRLLSHKMQAEPYWTLRLAMGLLDSLQTGKNDIDADRIYLTGLSMGGFAVWELLQRAPTRFAAALPICGGGDPAFAVQIAQNNIWAVHGKNDKLVKPSRTTDMTNAIRKAGGNPQITLLPNVGHLCWNEAYSNHNIITWWWQTRKNEKH